MATQPVIEVGPVWARLAAPPPLVAKVREHLRADDPAAPHTWSYKTGRWDGKVDFAKNGIFLSGLTWRVARYMKTIGATPVVNWPDVGSLATEPLDGEMLGVEWRPYQLDAVSRALRMRRMVLQCPTRGGKTEIAMEFIRQVGGNALWVTHTDELRRQTPQRFWDRLRIECGVVQGKRRDTDSPVVVGMVQTLARLARPTVPDKRTKRRVPNPDYDPEFFEQFDVLVMDEAHHASADTWQAVAAACVNCNYRLGLSGTVDEGVVDISELNRLKIEGALGPTYTVETTMGLAAQGFVSTPRVVVLSCPRESYPEYETVREFVCPDWRDDPRGLLSKLGPKLFAESYQRGVIDNSARNRLVVDTATRHARQRERFLVLCNRVPHADYLARRLQESSALGDLRGAVWMLSGDSSSAEREATLTEFKRQRDGAILVCTPFFREGVDVPQIDAGFLAGGGESDVALLQALGRMLTARADKPEVLIYDVADGNDPRHEKDYLARHFRSRLNRYEQSGFTVERR